MPTLEISTMIGCPQRCTYCPQDALREAYPRGAPRMLSLEDFVTVLGKVPPYVRIDLSGFAEPWANPDCTAMLEAALASGRQVAIYTTLLGMKPADVEQLVGLFAQHREQIEVVCLHLPDANGNMRGFRDSEDYRYALTTFRAMAQNGRFRRFETMTMDAQGHVDPTLPVERLLPWVGHDRAGALEVGAVGAQPVQQPVAHRGPVSCSYTPFYDQNVLLPNGDVVLCCMDYSRERVVGNLLRQSYEEIFAGPEMARLRAANMTPGRGSICKACTRAVRHDLAPGAHQMWTDVQPRGE